MASLLLIVINVLIVGCNSETANLSPIRFKPNKVFIDVPGGLPADGGILLWGSTSAGDAFGERLEDANEIIFTENGDWSFYAVKYDSSITGVRCAFIEKILTGGKTPLTLQFDASTCLRSEFKGSKDVADPANPVIGITGVEFCSDVTGVGTVDHECTDRESDQRIHSRGHAQFYQIAFVEYEKSAGSSATIQKEYLGTCISAAGINNPFAVRGTGLAALGLSQHPVGNGTSTPFFLKMYVYTQASPVTKCDDPSARKFSLDLEHGLKFLPAEHFGKAVFSEHVNFVNSYKMYVEVTETELCLGQPLTEKIPRGAGTPSDPLLICNEFQLMWTVGKGIPNTGLSFKLLRDLDFSGFGKGLYPAPGSDDEPEWYKCLHTGGNFISLDIQLSGDVNAPDCVSFGYRNLSWGNGHSIKGLRMAPKGIHGANFLGIMNGGAGIQDLTFLSPEVAGTFANVAVLSAHASNAAIVQNIHVKDAVVRGKNATFIGGVFGQFSPGTRKSILKNIKVENLRVEAMASTHVGGFAGGMGCGMPATVAQPYDAENIAVEGSIIGMDGSISLSGIAGATDGCDFNKVKFEGSIEGKAIIGGLFGVAGDSTKVTSAYVQAGLRSSNSDTTGKASIGGFVGRMRTNADTVGGFTDGYFLGKIIQDCSIGAGCNTGNIIGEKITNDDPLTYSDFLFPVTRVYHNNSSPVAAAFSDQGLPLATASFNDPSSFPADFTSAFSMEVNDIPRLSFEDPDTASDTAEIFLHPCRNEPLALKVFGDQTGRGTASNPFFVCNFNQFKTMSAGAGLTYELQGHLTAAGPLPSSAVDFTATFDGSGFSIIGLEITNHALPATANTPMGIWAKISGTVRNVDFLYPVINDPTLTVKSTALLAHENSGTIENINIRQLTGDIGLGDGTFGHGTVVSKNLESGLISFVDVESKLDVRTYASGLVYYNKGRIQDTKIKSVLNCVMATQCTHLFGVTNQNESPGHIARVDLEPQINAFKNAVVSSSSFFLVLSSNYGTIEDLFIRESAYIHAPSGRVHALQSNRPGAIIKHLYNKGTVVVANPTDPTGDPLDPTDDGGDLPDDRLEPDPLMADPGSFFIQGASSGVGWNEGSSTELLYSQHARQELHSSQGQYTASTISLHGSGHCLFRGANGFSLPAQWQKIMSGSGNLFSRLGIVNEIGKSYSSAAQAFSSFGPLFNEFLIHRPETASCASISGPAFIPFFYPHTQNSFFASNNFGLSLYVVGEVDGVDPAWLRLESHTKDFSKFSSWQGNLGTVTYTHADGSMEALSVPVILDVSANPVDFVKFMLLYKANQAAIHPAWLFDTTHGLRPFHQVRQDGY